MARARSKNARGEGDRLRRELLAAVDAVLDETGDPAKVTVRGVAGRVGVAPNAVYLHFADREELLAAVLVERFAAWGRVIRAAVDEAGDDPVARLRAGHLAYCRFATEQAGHYRLLFGPGEAVSSRPELARRIEEEAYAVFEVLVDCCARVVEAGVVGRVDPMALAASLWAMQHGYADLAATVRGSILADPGTLLDTLLEAAAPR